MFDQDSEDEDMICSSPVATMKISCNPFSKTKRRSKSTYLTEIGAPTTCKPTWTPTPMKQIYKEELFDDFKAMMDSRNSKLRKENPLSKTCTPFINPKTSYVSSAQTMCESLENFNEYGVRNRHQELSDSATLYETVSNMSDIKLDDENYYTRFSSPLVGLKNQKHASNTQRIRVRVSDYQTNSKNLRSEGKKNNTFSDLSSVSTIGRMTTSIHSKRLNIDLSKWSSVSMSDSVDYSSKTVPQYTSDSPVSPDYNTTIGQHNSGLKHLNKEISEKLQLVKQLEAQIKEQDHDNMELVSQLNMIVLSQLC
jgi:hypothetical protein